MSPDAKKARIQTSMRILKDEPVPEGYLRFRYVIFNFNKYFVHANLRTFLWFIHETYF